MVGLISIIIITVISFAMMMEGWEKYDSRKFYTGLLVTSKRQQTRMIRIIRMKRTIKKKIFLFLTK